MNKEELYDLLCGLLDCYFTAFDPCRIHIGKDGCFTCEGKTVCCGDCKYLGPDGCTIKCLGCKLYICYALQKKQPKLKTFLDPITALAKKHNLIKMWTPKEELFKREGDPAGRGTGLENRRA